jgi:organic hydroperoxide reductase OsmC/OhrA
VTLRPAVAFSGAVLPSDQQVAAMHEEAHEACFIANSVRTQVVCEPVLTPR